MHSIKTTTENYARSIVQKKRAAPHPLAACADEIEKVIPFTKSYGRGYWLRQLSLYQKRHNIDPAAMYTFIGKGPQGQEAGFGLLKELAGMEAKYNKGGTLTNKLKA